MQSIRPSNGNRGFSLVELLVATVIISMAMAVAGAFFVAARTTITDQIVRTETLQGLRASMDEMVRDLRLGGACLPVTGDFVTLDSVNSGTDQIVTRTGLVRPNETCVRTVTTADITATTATIPVQTANGFTSTMRVYICNTSCTTGELFNLTGVNTAGNTLTTGTTLTAAYGAGAGIYAVDERQYKVDTSNPSLPVLALGVNGATATPFAIGIENLQLQYQLARNCSASAGCDVVDVPANSTEFALVNQIFITLTARSRTTLSTGQYYRVARTVSAKPRNLLPG
jgi:prepilin-type N-terminal cleavage/methylation domain-containing protein